MAKIALEKYVGGCVKALNEKFNEGVIVEYVKSVAHSGDYNDLTTRVAYDVCKVIFKPWKEFSQDDYDSITDNKLRSLYLKAFQTAFPTAWATIKEIG